MRKYDALNKRNIFIVLVICAIILIIFSLFIKRVNDLGKKVYTIDANSVVYDKDKNMWNLSSTGSIKIKWSGAYYMQYEDEEVALDKQVVVFNNASKVMNLYGTIFKINSDESVETLKDETIIDDTVVPKFYKLADRKYLLIASDIKNEDASFTATDYLIVELDKLGNALLINNKVNMKTLKETKLITSLYTFDIANEILHFDGKDINLKKIIGSTNEYEPPKESSSENNPGNASTPGTSDDNPGVPDGEDNPNGEGGENGEGNSGNGSFVDNKVYQDKNFSVVKNTVGTNYLNIDYSIYDPKGEYRNVYLEIQNDQTKTAETYYLAKNGTNLKISRLLPFTKYNIIYKYSYMDNEGNVLNDSFDMNYSITTLFPETSIDVTKMTNSNVYYTLKENDAFMYSATVELYIDDVKKDTYVFTSGEAAASYTGSFDISKYENFGYLSLKCTSITYATGPINVDVSLKVKN